MRRPARGRVRRVDQARPGDRDVPRVPVVGLPIGERELHRLRDRVDVFRAVVSERTEIEAVQDLQHLDQDRPLAPEGAGDDLAGAEGSPHGRLEAHPEGRQILPRQEPTFRGVIARDGRRDVAPIERGACGGEPGPATPAARGAVLVRQVAQGPTEIRLDEPLPRPGRSSPRQEDRRRGRPAAVGRLVLADDPRDEGSEREPVPRALDRRLGDLREAEGAEALERGDPGVRGARDDGAQESLGHIPAASVAKELERGPAGPDAEPGNRRHDPALSLVDHDRGDPREARRCPDAPHRDRCRPPRPRRRRCRRPRACDGPPARPAGARRRRRGGCRGPRAGRREPGTWGRSPHADSARPTGRPGVAFLGRSAVDTSRRSC